MEYFHKFHDNFKNIVSWGAYIYGVFLAITFPIILPLIRLLRQIDKILCLSYPFFIAINTDKIGLSIILRRWRSEFMLQELHHYYFQSRKTLAMRLFEYMETNEDSLYRNSIKRFFYFTLLMLTAFLALLEGIIFRVLWLIGILIGIVLLPIVWLIKLMIIIIFADYYTTNHFFEQAVEAHLRFSSSKLAEERLGGWIIQGKVPDMMEYRPLLNRIGGGKLRKTVANTYKDANTWWYDAIK